MVNMILHKRIANLLQGQFYNLVVNNWIKLKYLKLS